MALLGVTGWMLLLFAPFFACRFCAPMLISLKRGSPWEWFSPASIVGLGLVTTLLGMLFRFLAARAFRRRGMDFPLWGEFHGFCAVLCGATPGETRP